MRTALVGWAGVVVLGLAGCPPSLSTGPGEGGGPGGECTTCTKKNSSAGNVGAGGGSGSASSGRTSAGSSGGGTSGASSGGSSSASASSAASSAASSSSTSGGSSSGGGTTGGSTGGSSSGGSGCSPLQAAGGPCISQVDCQSPLVCVGAVCPAPGTCTLGSCVAPGPVPTLQCVRDGATCTDGGLTCCGGTCVSGTCTPWAACGLTNATCATNADCCDFFSCSSGLCAATCQNELGPCQKDSDCCTDQGLTCAYITQLSASVCVPQAEDQPQGVSQCGGHCSTFECQLAASCEVYPDGGDPCNAAGFICDPGTAVCRNPEAYYPCTQGGPSCEPYEASTVPSQCIDLGPEYGNRTLCLQPCLQTSDCADPFTSCDSSDMSFTGGGFCNGNDCSTPFATCPSSGASDGLCEPVGPGNTLCHQAATDGGGVGQSCDVYDNRQQGQLCAYPNICIGGLCAPSCNAGTTGTPGCSGGTQCYPTLGSTTDADDMGVCSVSCDFTSPDGGGCAKVSGGPDQKCLPLLDLTGQDEPTGFCVAEVPAAVALGQPCPVEPSGLDSCGAGLLCIQPTVAQNARCFQLCNLVSSVPGTGGCTAPHVCTALNVGGSSQPTNTGYCQ